MNQTLAADIPDAPWTLQGSALAMLSARGVLAFVHYEMSPVGAYDEMALAKLTWRGPRVTQMPVTSERSMRGGRAIWGFPKWVRAMRWTRNGRRVCFDDGSRVWRFRLGRSSPRVSLRAWTIQTLHGADVRVPVRIEARFSLAWSGRTLALHADDFEMVVEAPVAI